MTENNILNEKYFLITRPLPQAIFLKEAFEPHRIHCIVNPLLTIEYFPVNTNILESYAGFIATSVHGLLALCQIQENIPFHLKDKIIFAVGQKTAEYAKKIGFEHIIVGQENAKSLFEKIATFPLKQPDKLLYLRGQEVTEDLDSYLQESEIQADQFIVYKSETNDFTPDVKALFQHNQILGITLTSRKIAQQFLYLCHQYQFDIRDILIVCYSKKIKDFVRQTYKDIGRIMVSTLLNDQQDIDPFLIKEIQKR